MPTIGFAENDAFGIGTMVIKTESKASQPLISEPVR
jgi:hypothetical protein